MSVLSVYRSLNVEQKRILNEKTVDLNRPVEEILTLLKPLAACDTVADKSRTPLGCTFGICIPLLIGAFIVFSNVGWSWWSYLVLAALIAVLVGAFVLWRWTKHIDLSNNFRQFVLPVLTVLREDFAPGEPVHVHLDLSEPTDAKKKTGQLPPYASGAYHKVIESTYVDRWMTADATLADGSKLSWSIEDSIRERKKTKRNARGKYKTKTKYTKKSDIDVELGLRKKLYDVSRPAGAEIEDDEKRNTVKHSRKIKSPSLDPLDPRALIDLLTEVYRNTSPAGKEA